MRIKRTPRKTPVKTAHSTVPGFNGGNTGIASPSYKSMAMFTPTKNVGTLSPFKTFPSGPKPVHQQQQEILSIFELLDLPNFVLNLPSHMPSALHSNITSMNVTPTKEFTQKNEIFESIGQNPYLGKRSFDVIGYANFDDIQEGMLSGQIGWGQLVFSKKCLEYLKQNRKLLKSRNVGY